MLRVHVQVDRETLPGHDRPARAVRNRARPRFEDACGRKGSAVGGPGRIDHARSEDVLREDVTRADDARITPCDHSPVRPVRGDRRVTLIPWGGAQRAAVRGPRGIDDACVQYVLGKDVEAARGAATVVPGDDRATGRVLLDRGKLLETRRVTHDQAIRGPAGIHDA